MTNLTLSQTNPTAHLLSVGFVSFDGVDVDTILQAIHVVHFAGAALVTSSDYHHLVVLLDRHRPHTVFVPQLLREG